MHFEFSYVFSPKVTTFSPKPEFEMVFRTSTFLVKDALGIPGIWWTKNDIILVGFRVDNYWLLSTLSTEWWERNRSELKPVPLVSSFYATRRLNFFSVPNFFYQKTPDQRHCFLTKQVLYKQCLLFFFLGSHASLSLNTSALFLLLLLLFKSLCYAGISTQWVGSKSVWTVFSWISFPVQVKSLEINGRLGETEGGWYKELPSSP